MIKIGFISLEIFILLVVFAALLALSYKYGKRPIIALIISAYPSLLIFQYFPYMSFDPGKPEAIAFIIIYVVTFIIINKVLGVKKLYTPTRKIIDYGILTLVYIALVISVSNNAMPSLRDLYTFTGIIPSLVNKVNFGVLLMIPFIAILITSKNDKY